MTVNGVNPLLQPEPDFHRPYCKVCGGVGMWFATQDEAQAAVAWHIFGVHRDVWMTVIGERREPNVPRPTPLDPQPNPLPTDIETQS